MKIVTKKLEHGWAFYMPLAYFGFFFLQPIFEHASRKQWLLTALGTVIFLTLYLGVLWTDRKPWQFTGLGAMVVVGALYAPFNSGASCFFIFAAAVLPYVVETEVGVLGLIGLIVAVAGLETWLLHLSGWFAFYAAGLSVVVGGTNIYFAQRTRMYYQLKKANEEIEHLAKIAERERIARDLHDVLGHTLSVIILKSELAGKLMDRDPQQAKAEMADVEKTSRKALAEVRTTIRGYRSYSLEAEIKQESVVALVVREAVTNVVRHAGARNCLLRLTPVNGSCRFEIQDDGRGGGTVEGNGLRGMRERIEALGGTLQRETKSGTRLTIEFPITPAAASNEDF
jgi:two-component system sensor histidine kinase DesK